MKKVIAIFDIGKTNKKVLLFDEKYDVVFQNEEKFPTIKDKDDFECDDIALINRWIKTSLEQILSSNNFELTAVNFTTYGASLMFLDNEGNELTPVYNYLKEISPSISEDLFKDYGGKGKFCRRTASPNLGLLLNSGIQILWLQKEKPDLFEQVKSIVHFPQYLSYQLTNQIISEPTSIGCHTFMWDFDQMNYHQWIKDHDIQLPNPVNNDVVFDACIDGYNFKVGTGIHDSSASLVPYLKGSSEKFILVSTGTWCINMNPFNDEPLTAAQLKQDCLCFMSPDQQQVKSSRLFMGHYHEVWAGRLATHFNVEQDFFKRVELNHERIDDLQNNGETVSVFFPAGKESFEEGLKNVDLAQFTCYDVAYTQLMIELTNLCVKSIQLVISEGDETKRIYISGGFARNPIFIELIQQSFPKKEVLISEIENSSAFGAALVISETLGDSESFNPGENFV